MSDIRSDIVEEAIKLRAKDGLHPTFDREYADLDWITPKGTSAECAPMMLAEKKLAELLLGSRRVLPRVP